MLTIDVNNQMRTEFSQEGHTTAILILICLFQQSTTTSEQNPSPLVFVSLLRYETTLSVLKNSLGLWEFDLRNYKSNRPALEYRCMQ